jgi:ubiquinone/menaquinone biosynthesis C-methylase UbiE
MRETETERVLAIFQRAAPKYDKKITFWERVLFKDGREWVCSQVGGDVLEIAIGTGRNLPFYGREVLLTGIELSPAMLDIARQRARELGRTVDLRVGDAQSLPFDDERFDAVVVTLALCSIPDDAKAVAEVKRVLRAGGRFVLLEHVRSPLAPVRVLQRLIEPIAVRLDGDHYVREPLDHLRREGFEIERAERSGLGIVERVSARKPEATKL